MFCLIRPVAFRTVSPIRGCHGFGRSLGWSWELQVFGEVRRDERLQPGAGQRCGGLLVSSANPSAVTMGKTYYYYLEPGTQCGPRHERSRANKLSIHFGPTGTVTGVLYERPAVQGQQ